MKTAAVALAVMAASTEALLSLDILPLGIDVDLGVWGPDHDPCAECIDTWHPPHGVIIDNCDDLGSGDWHWVHPCPEPHVPEYVWASSTVAGVQVSTIVDCPAEQPNCPGSSTAYLTVTYPGEPTIYPVPVTATATASLIYAPPPAPTMTAQETYAPPPTYVQPPQIETYVPEAPPAVPAPPAPPAPLVPTLSTSVYVPVEPTAPVYPPAQPTVYTPVVPNPPVDYPVYGNNATAPVSTPPYVTVPPLPTGAASNNAQNMGLAVAVGALAAYMM